MSSTSLGKALLKRSITWSSYEFLFPSRVAFSTDFQTNGVARPWLVTRYRQIVACLSASNSVQSSATTSSFRTPTTNRTQSSNKRASGMPALLRSRSICLVACFAWIPFAAAKPRPIA